MNQAEQIFFLVYFLLTFPVLVRKAMMKFLEWKFKQGEQTR